MSQVTKFPRLTSIANDNDSIAKELRILADDIEQGEYGIVDNVVCVLDSDYGVLRHSIGMPGLSKIFVAGLLAYSLNKLTNPE